MKRNTFLDRLNPFAPRATRSASRRRPLSRRRLSFERLGLKAGRLSMEPLENRLLLSVFTVTNTNDSGDGSLRQALLDANLHTNDDTIADTIAFNISGDGPHTIQPQSALPVITDPVIIDGYTQPGASPNTNPVGSGLSTVLMIELDGSQAGTANGLTIEAGNSTVQGLVINRFSEYGIYVGANGGNTIAGNFIGTDVTGTDAKANANHGIQITAGADGNVIGTNGDGENDVAERNLISGNAGCGVTIWTERNAVAGNLIGTEVTGTESLGNGARGVRLAAGGRANRIGTDGDGVADDAERNVISGNGYQGIWVENSSDNVVAGNYIGTDLTGTVAIGNSGLGAAAGVYVGVGAVANRIGTDGNGFADTAERNLISGNVNGVRIQGDGSSHNVVAGNYIGTDVTGTSPLGNYRGVVLCAAASANRIGTDGNGVGDAAERNVISGNTIEGVSLEGAGTDENLVAGNYIGTDATGTVALGNGYQGVHLTNGARANRVGTDGNGVADVAERNVISGNGAEGVLLDQTGTDQNVVAGNYIGTDVTGSVTDPDGIPESGDELGNGWDSAWSNGIRIASGSRFNRIGTNGDGMADEAERNIVSGNWAVQIGIFHAGTDGNVVAGNYIGTDVTGTVALSMGLRNGMHGVVVLAGAKANRIGTDGNGTADAAERNVISGNQGEGLALIGVGTEGNVVAGNYIGTDATGTAALGNAWRGVVIYSGAASNLIGTDGGAADEANTIAFSGSAGVAVYHDGTTGNAIRGNNIYENGGLGIELAVNDTPGVTLNDLGDTDTGANNLQNFPVLSEVGGGAATRVQGSLNSTPNTTFTLDFYASSEADPSGYGEGERWLGAITVTTDENGDASFDEVLPAMTSPGEVITATATEDLPEIVVDPGTPDDPTDDYTIHPGNTSEFSAAMAVQGFMVEIDVKPGSDSNPVNLNSSGVIAVAILADADFDPSCVQVDTVVFAGAYAVQHVFEDVDADGDLDLVMQFRIEDTNLEEIYRQLLADDQNADGVLDSTHQEVQAWLFGQTTLDELFAGVDDVDVSLSGKHLRELLDELFGAGTA